MNVNGVGLELLRSGQWVLPASLRDNAPCVVERGLLASDAGMDVNPPVTAWKAPWDALLTAEERGGESRHTQVGHLGDPRLSR